MLKIELTNQWKTMVLSMGYELLRTYGLQWCAIPCEPTIQTSGYKELCQWVTKGSTVMSTILRLPLSQASGF